MEDERGGGVGGGSPLLHPHLHWPRPWVIVGGYAVPVSFSRVSIPRVPVLLWVALALGACGGRVPVRGAPRATTAATTPVDPLATPWQVGNARAVRTQRILVEAQLTSSVDSTVRTDSVSSDLLVRWGDAPGAVMPEALTGVPLRVLRYAVRVAPDTAWRTPPGVRDGFEVSATLRRGGIPVLCETPSTACAVAQVAAAQGWQESWLGAPGALVPGSRWRDSTTYTVWRDSIPLVVTSVREFTVREGVLRDGAATLRIDRRTTQQLVGEGRQFGETVRISGTGDGEMRLEVALADGTVLRGDGTAVLTLTLVGRRRVQELTQASRITITAPR